jgi:hypothetical protein
LQEGLAFKQAQRAPCAVVRDDIDDLFYLAAQVGLVLLRASFGVAKRLLSAIVMMSINASTSKP